MKNSIIVAALGVAVASAQDSPWYRPGSLASFPTATNVMAAPYHGTNAGPDSTTAILPENTHVGRGLGTEETADEIAETASDKFTMVGLNPNFTSQFKILTQHRLHLVIVLTPFFPLALLLQTSSQW